MSIFSLFKPNIEKLKAEKKVNPLITALHYKKDWNVRKSAAEALKSIGWEPINGEGIYYLIALNDWRKLIHMGTSAVQPLLEVLQDENSSSLHRDCIKALGKIGDKRAVTPLIDILLKKDFCTYTNAKGSMFPEHSCDPRLEAAAALGKIKDKRAIQTLIKVMEEKGDNDLIEKSAWALSEIEDKRT